MATRKEGTALGAARTRFVDGLPRKAEELKGALALLVGSPAGERSREEMRRRLHALYASAQVFRIASLASALKEGIVLLDEARDAEREIRQDELDHLTNLASTLSALGESGRRSSSPPSLTGPPSSVPAPPGSKPPASVASRTPRLAKTPYSGDNAQPSISPPRGTSPKDDRTTLPGPVQAAPASGAGDAELGSPPAVIQQLPEVPQEGVPGAGPRQSSGSFSAADTSSRPPTLPGAPLETVVSVLLLDHAQAQAQVRAALPDEHFEVLTAADPEEAIRLARTSAPDIVFADHAIALRDGDLIGRLRSDPLTDFVPVVLTHAQHEIVDEEALRQRGADAVLAKPATTHALVSTIGRLTGLTDGPWRLVIGDATVEEVADRLAKEIHRGLVESAASGRDVKVALGEGSELLAAAWSTIARVRARLAERSQGQVRFRDVARRGGPAFMALAAHEDDSESDGEDVNLEGRRIIVADDDPAVVWFFAGLLREQGADVVEVEDGVAALEAARRKRPDVILSDILMPGLDGLGLCREIQRDPALGEIPVVLLSWKEDFLQRMRELKSGAKGYLRKEAASGQILAQIRDVLRPRARLEQQLATGGEVRGRIEAVGVLPLLRSVALRRPDARVTFRDAWNLFEVDVRGGELVDVTRTATDGSFARGLRALPQLVGAGAGRYAVAENRNPVRASLGGSVEETLGDAVEQLGALVDTVSGTGLSRVATLRFDREILEPSLRTASDAVRAAVEALQQGVSPTQLLVRGMIGPQELEASLVDLARRGAIIGAADRVGRDLVREALDARGARAAPEWVPQSSHPPGAAPSAEVDAALADAQRALLTAPTNAPLSSPPSNAVAPRERQDVPPARSRTERAEGVDATTPRAMESQRVDGAAPVEPQRVPGAELGAPEDEPEGADTEEDTEEWILPEDGDVAKIKRGRADPTAKGPPPPAVAAPAAEGAGEAEAERASEASKGVRDGPQEGEVETADGEAPADEGSDAEPVDDAPTPHPASAAEDGGRDGGLTFATYLLFLSIAFAVGYALWSAYGASQPPDLIVPAEGSQPPPVGAPEPDPSVGPEPPSAQREDPARAGASGAGTAGTTGGEPSAGAPSASELSYGQTVARILDAGVPVAEEEGLLLVRASSDGVETRVAVNIVGEPERMLGAAPVGVALGEGRYELVFRRGAEEKFRYVFVRAGQTRVVLPE